ncbi:zf-TFIIB domain-containing protein [Candidatus Roizmanbacteria bacterium]|nr:zf-TFIIB domain-containing protein [Candidatus Roizmanbacteria bacterium]
MVCPNCSEKMNLDVMDGQTILHCPNCGGTFFEENGINRISFATAQRLADEKKVYEISTSDKLCPKDQTILAPIRSEESVPPDVTLFGCSTCHGLFAYPNDLVIFKKAQAVKIDYFKIWSIPLPSIKSIAVLSVFLFVSLVSLITYLYWQKQNISSYIQAQDLIKNLYLTTSNRYLFISFKTLIPLRSRIIFTVTSTNETVNKVVSGELTTFHQLTTADVNIEDEIYYQIVLRDEKGRETRTEMKRIDFTKSQ